METLEALWDQQALFEFKLTISGKDHFFRYERHKGDYLITLSYLTEYGGEKVDFPAAFLALIVEDDGSIVDKSGARCAYLEKMFIMHRLSRNVLMYEKKEVLRFESVALTKITATAFDLTKKLEFNF